MLGETVHQAWHGFVDLFYPRFCPACSTSLKVGERYLCLNCYYTLPETDFLTVRNNPMEKTFWGRLPLQKAAAYLNFTKKGKAQRLVHAVKYEGHWDLGRYIGYQFGTRMVESRFSKGLDSLIPVPLHPQKAKQRGYNQAEAFGLGVSEATGIPMFTDVIKRSTASSTQTRKGRYDRWLNVNNIFDMNQETSLESQHVLLFDDVMTTGATLEAMGHTMQTFSNVKISVATVGFAAALA